MKKLKTFNLRSSHNLSTDTMPGDSPSHHQNNHTATTAASNVFNKLLNKRYSHLKFMRSSPGRRHAGGATSQPVSSGSYDMNGHDSDDLKREIGAPILISKTRIDCDRTDCTINVVVGDDDDRHQPVSVAELLQQRSAPPLYDVNDIQFTFITPESSPPAKKSSTMAAYDLLPPTTTTTVMTPKNRSKSATNLHKSEIRVYLHKAPSLEALENNGTVQYHKSHGTPQMLSAAATADGGGSSISAASSSEGSLIYNNTSKDDQHQTRRENIDKNYLRPDEAPTPNGSSHDCSPEFDMKSASFQSLDARDLFRSIEELNEITRQINESEEFGNATQEIDLEYCEHRDRLRPDQRRITLLRNRHMTAGPLYLDRKKEKLSNVWTGLKHWIGEEKDRLRDVMQRHAALQRVGGGGAIAEEDCESRVGTERRQNGGDNRLSMSPSSDGYCPAAAAASSTVSSGWSNGGVTPTERRLDYSTDENTEGLSESLATRKGVNSKTVSSPNGRPTVDGWEVIRVVLKISTFENSIHIYNG